MATKETPPPPPTDAPPPKKSKKLLIIALAAVVLLIVLAGAVIVLLKPPPADDENGPSPKKKEMVEKPAGPPSYLTMEGYTINIQGDAGDQFLRLELSAQFEEAVEAERAKLYMPSIRNKILLLLSGKKVADLSPKAGKEILAQEIKMEMNGILATPDDPKKSPGGPVREILFTEFVIQ